ncbi:MAG TPA: ergothioneine biosynthesis protein EgtB [Longimicrobiales bacterium]|nr:ergothioneine biosynthesis protein EgtB [Longimicrobiales bacterium]
MATALAHPSAVEAGASAALRERLAARYDEVRGFTDSLTEGLAAEDMVVQSMADVSPTKWHLAHTSWFFETFVLLPNLDGYRPLDAAYAYLFNSYYVQAGERHCRAQRGYISRPTVAEVRAYRRHVDAAIRTLLERLPEDRLAELEPLLTLGLHHEQQHQELMLTDIKHVFSVNPLRPVYRAAEAPRAGAAPAAAWVDFPEGLHWVGWAGPGFAYDNEGPRHREFVEPFALASRLVTNGEYLEFMADGGYRRPELWLSMGWATREQNDWTEPFYWERRDGDWWLFTLSGMHPVEPAEPVCHLSYFEADAFARWAGARLPTEFEWEVAAAGLPAAGNFVEDRAYHPLAAARGAGLLQMYGDVWEWTRSQYTPYPGFQPAAGAVGEYNGKFMCNQFVLRGGSCATSVSHIRPTYRNFFPPDACWQFTGVRLARDLR